MSDVAILIKDLLVATVLNEKVLLPAKSRAEWILILLSALLAGTGIFFLIVSLHQFLEQRYTPDLAALGSAIVVLAVSFLMAMAAHRYKRQKISRLGAARNEIGNNIHALIDDVCNEMEGPIRENPKTAVLLAMLAGFFVMRQNAEL